MSLQLGVHGMPPAKRRVILRELATARGVTQRGLANTLQKLHDRGLLTDALVRTPTPKQYRRAIQAAVEDISEKVTPCRTRCPIYKPADRRWHGVALYPPSNVFDISDFCVRVVL